MEELNQIVVFKVGKEFYGSSIKSIKEIKEIVDITQIPQMPNGMDGVINLRGCIHAIYSLWEKLEIEIREKNKNNKIIVLNEKNIGFIVDEVNEIIRIEAIDLDEATSLPSHIKKDYILGIVNKNDRLIVVLDLHKLFSLNEYEGELVIC